MLPRFCPALRTLLIWALWWWRGSADHGDFTLTTFLPTVHPTLSEQWDTTTSYKHDWCAVALDVAEGRKSLRDALRGTNVSVAMDKGFDVNWMNYDEGHKEFIGGFQVNLLHDVALRGGFNVLPVAFEHPLLENGEDWSSWLFRVFAKVDMVGVWFVDTAARRSAGALFPFQFVDTSLQTAAHFQPASEHFEQQLFLFLKPFTANVWIMLVAGTLFTAILVWVLERKKNEDMFPGHSSHNILEGVGRSLYSGGSLFSQSGNWEPVSPVGRLVVFSWSMVVLVVFTTYTAELTSYLAKETETTSSVKGIMDAVTQEGVICARRGAAAVDMLKFRYPKANILEINEDDMFPMLRNGECLVLVAGRGEFELWVISEDLNPDCDVEVVGSTFTSWGGSYVVGQDTQQLCGSLVSHTLSVLMTELYEEEVIMEHWTDMLASLSTATCTATSSTSEFEGAVSLNSVGGIFILHLGVAVISLLLYRFARRGHVQAGLKIKTSRLGRSLKPKKRVPPRHLEINTMRSSNCLSTTRGNSVSSVHDDGKDDDEGRSSEGSPGVVEAGAGSNSRNVISPTTPSTGGSVHSGSGNGAPSFEEKSDTVCHTDTKI